MLIRSLTLAVLMIISTAAFSASTAITPRIDLLGNPAPSTAATRTIVITPETKWVNVEGGEIINFVVGKQSFAWDFYVGASVWSFDLQLVAPAGILDHSVKAYLTPDPRYRSRD